jgi:ferredoxin
MGLKPSRDESLSPYCWNCGACVDCCDHEALRFIWRDVPLQQLKIPADIEVSRGKSHGGGGEERLSL